MTGPVRIVHIGDSHVRGHLYPLITRRCLEHDFGAEDVYKRQAREEASTSGSSTGIIFILCFVVVYLLLSAQYESYILPLSVLLSVPFGLLGSFLFVNGFARCV